jgi:hypothetical protein
MRLKIGDLEILDNVPTSHWNKFVTYWRGGDKRKRETASAMVDLEVVNVKPVHSLTASELVVKVFLVIICANLLGEGVAAEVARRSGYSRLHNSILRI